MFFSTGHEIYNFESLNLLRSFRECTVDIQEFLQTIWKYNGNDPDEIFLLGKKRTKISKNKNLDLPSF